MHTHKGGYLKYWNNDWKGERVSKLDGVKEHRHTVPTGNKVERSKERNIEGGCKLFYNRADGKRNGVGIMVREELVKSVLEVKRILDRLMARKLEVKGSILNIVSMYAPQVNNSIEEKIIFGKTWMG